MRIPIRTNEVYNVINMNGAIPARIGYAYQDHCALYFLMNEYISGRDFIFISELDEIDFETHHPDHLFSYQAKTNGQLSASEVNKLINKHQSRIQNFNKKEGKLIILSESNLKKALKCLIAGSWSDKTIEKYCLAALDNIDRKNLVIESKDFSRDEIVYLLHGLVNEFLKKLKGNSGYPAEVVSQLIDVLLQKIVKISREADEANRALDKDKVSEEIFRFVKNLTWRDGNGRRKESFPPLPDMSTKREVFDSKLLEKNDPLDAKFSNE